MTTFKHWFAFWISVPLALTAADEPPAGLEIRDYTGWPGSIYLNATETPVQAVIVPTVGGRLVHYSLDGENILFENSATAGQTMSAGQEELWLGGYQCDVGGQEALPAHLTLLQGPAQWKFKGDFAAHVSGPPDTNLGIVIDKDFLLAPDTGELGVMQRLRNISDKEVSYYLRDVTVCKGAGFALIPLNPKSRFKAGWSQHRPTDARENFDGSAPSAFQVRVLDGVLVIATSGEVTQIGADSVAGWIAYAWNKLLLVKYFPVTPGGHYRDAGNTVEVYFDQRAVELSPLSPEINLPPGRDFTFPEKWELIQLSKEVTTWEDARKLVRKIPPTPFKQ